MGRESIGEKLNQCVLMPGNSQLLVALGLLRSSKERHVLPRGEGVLS